MKWIKIPDRQNVREYLPKNGMFLGIWKGCFCICEFDEEIDHFYVGTLPAIFLGFWKLEKERESKFSYYCKFELPENC